MIHFILGFDIALLLSVTQKFIKKHKKMEHRQKGFGFTAETKRKVSKKVSVDYDLIDLPVIVIS